MTRLSLLLSIVSTAVSGASFALALIAFKRGNPRVSVSIWKTAIVGVSTRRIFTIVVHNSGRSAVTIRDVGLLADQPGQQRLSIQDERRKAIAIDGPDLPCRIESYGFIEWRVDGGLAGEAFGMTTRVFAYAELVAIRDRRWNRGWRRPVRTTYEQVVSKWSEHNVGN